jgi:hypothetical protein
MRCKSLGILGALAILPAFGQVANSTLSQDELEKIIPHQFGPIQAKLENGDGTVVDTNWSGYAVLGSSFESVFGSWVVPKSDCSKSLAKSAVFWVGIDGYNSSTVEQTGTVSVCALGIPYYFAWYEFYPSNLVLVKVPVQPGDLMSASVVYSSTTGEFTTTITNTTTGKSATQSQAVPGAVRNSAEWIAEAPASSSMQILPFADFGTVLFGQDNTGISGTNYATDESTSGTIGSFLPVNIIQIKKGFSFTSFATSTCSALSSDGTSFSCVWAPY